MEKIDYPSGPSIEELIREISRSRKAIRRDLTGLFDGLNVPAQISRNVRKAPTVWMGGAAFFGFLLAKFSFRSRGKRHQSSAQSAPIAQIEVPEEIKGAGFLAMTFGVLKFLFPLAKPFITAYAARYLAGLADWIEARNTASSSK